MSDRIYTCEFEGVAVTTAVDLFELQPADDKPVEVVGLFLSQSSDLGDAQEEVLRFRVVRGNATTGTGGAQQAVAPVPVNSSDAAAGFTYDTCNTTAASTGTAVNLHSDGFNIRTGYGLWLPDGCEWQTKQAVLLVVRLMAAPADSVTLSGTMYVRELG